MKKFVHFTIFRGVKAHISILIHYISVHLSESFVKIFFQKIENFFFHYFAVKIPFSCAPGSRLPPHEKDPSKILCFFSKKYLLFESVCAIIYFVRWPDISMGV